MPQAATAEQRRKVSDDFNCTQLDRRFDEERFDKGTPERTTEEQTTAKATH